MLVGVLPVLAQAATCTEWRVSNGATNGTDPGLSGWFEFKANALNDWVAKTNVGRQGQKCAAGTPIGNVTAGQIDPKPSYNYPACPDFAGQKFPAGEAFGQWESRTSTSCTDICQQLAGTKVPGGDHWEVEVPTAEAAAGDLLMCHSQGGSPEKFCAADGQKDLAVGQPDGTWLKIGNKGMTYTGSSCVPGTGQGQVPSGTTGDGSDATKCSGTINGVTVEHTCMDVIESTPKTSTRTVPKPDGSTDTVKEDVKTETKCEGDTCTTTKTTTTTVTNNVTNNTTTETKTESQTQNKGGFCKESPESKLCGDSSFGGSCKADGQPGGYQCSGDAAMCAAAKATWETRCVLSSVAVKDTDPILKVGADAMTGTDPDDHPRKQKEDVDLSNSFNTTNPFSSGGLSDKTISLGGGLGSITIPLSSANSTLQMMGSLLVALTMLTSALWVVRGT